IIQSDFAEAVAVRRHLLGIEEVEAVIGDGADYFAIEMLLLAFRLNEPLLGRFQLAHGPLALGDLAAERSVGARQVGGPLPDALFQLLAGPPQRLVLLRQLVLQADHALALAQPGPELIAIERLADEVIRPGVHGADEIFRPR